eukprot:TRINITY_DN4398_c0_g1_i6.p1 TRINITY_DN4398_c0_g1~~TRINITY_DN4398_c0_g1_i6.p1  ORF type:complete len:193 (-),score=27.16 TRINITY_DN4398_c0_g1_i6:162-695(-)
MASLKDYMKLVTSYDLWTKNLSNCESGQASLLFEAWNVASLAMLIAIMILDAILIGVVTLGVGLLFWAPFAFITVAVSFLTSWLSWYCVVSEKGCCGKLGYLCWGIYFALECYSLVHTAYIQRQKGWFLTLFNVFTTVGRCVACAKLFMESEANAKRSVVLQNDSESCSGSGSESNA